jgi:hypothetical protein
MVYLKIRPVVDCRNITTWNEEIFNAAHHD